MTFIAYAYLDNLLNSLTSVAVAVILLAFIDFVIIFSIFKNFWVLTATDPDTV